MHIEQLGPYRIGKKLGGGGMGSVYEAWDDTSGVRVAVKVLSPHLAKAEGFRDRFEGEIDSLKKLQHVGIVRLYGYGEQDGILFYSMELVDGTSLEEEIAAGRRFDWHETLDIGVQVCRALKHAHDHGVVHRDIKPANLLLTDGGRVKIADFGIARLFGGNQLTTAGGVLGTADYMSPEQADGRPVTAKCDQYSLGGVLYALLAGQPPFRAKTLPEMLQLQRFAEPVPVRRYAPDIPEQLDRLILQLLSKEPEDRFPNVMVLRRHMEAMTKALSRSVSRDARGPEEKAGSTESPGSPQVDRTATNGLREATLDLEGNPLLPTGADKVPSHLFDAPTVADPLAEARESSPIPSSTEVTQAAGSRFTTVDQEESRWQTQPSGNLLQLTAQLLAILAALGLLIWGGWWLMRPATADDLYVQIMGAVEEKGTDNLRVIEKPLREFYQRFEQDPRAVELDKYREELELQQMERKLRRNVTFGGTRQMSPIGRLYGMAISTASKDPLRGVEMLSSLLALYDPEDLSDPARVLPQESSASLADPGGLHSPREKASLGEETLSEEDRRWLVIARRQHARLLDRAREQRANLSRSLRERLQVAVELQPTRPEVATRMFQAMVDLYSGQAWASEIVAQARDHLERELKEGLP
jgi:serine/threonine-protein kinase